MYIPADFSETDDAEIRALVARHPLAVCVCVDSDGLRVNHIPTLWEGDALIGHVASANPLHERIADGSDAVFVFCGEEAYISPNWYPSKADTHRAVPTWNYQVVHIRGRIYFDHSEKAKRAAIGKLTLHQERRTNGKAAWKMSDAPRDFMQTMLDHIVAFRVEITGVEAKSKVSQNKSQADFDNVLEKMTTTGASELAARMRSL